MTIHGLPLPNSPCLLIKPSFSSSSLHQSSRIRYGFSYFLKVFHVLAFDFLEFVFLLSFEDMMLNMVYGFFLSLMNGFC